MVPLYKQECGGTSQINLGPHSTEGQQQEPEYDLCANNETSGVQVERVLSLLWLGLSAVFHQAPEDRAVVLLHGCELEEAPQGVEAIDVERRGREEDSGLHLLAVPVPGDRDVLGAEVPEVQAKCAFLTRLWLRRVAVDEHHAWRNA